MDSLGGDVGAPFCSVSVFGGPPEVTPLLGLLHGEHGPGVELGFLVVGVPPQETVRTSGQK